MKNNDPFYIGWQSEIAPSTSKFLRNRLLPVFILMPILAFLLVVFQKTFNNHKFELGNVSEVSGVYYDTPFPLLVADEGLLPAELSREILLVGYGKFGAKSTMDGIQKSKGSLNGKRITLKGTLIYGDGKTLMELTKKGRSLVKIQDETIHPNPTIKMLSHAKVEGEILDPKCYFGVMKPGEGKIHKSCAIRCISGGIPPVFRHTIDAQSKYYEYYLMLDQNGNALNKKILDQVGEQVTTGGKVSNFLTWNVIYIDPDHINPLEI